jgi:hypothetical protein
MINTGLQVIYFIFGLLIVLVTTRSFIRVFVLPRAAQDPLVRGFFLGTRLVFDRIIQYLGSYTAKDQFMAYYAPVTLILLLPFWYALMLVGYMLMYKGLGAESWYLAFRDSGSSLLTLGFEPVNSLQFSILAFSEAIIGLIMVALLIAYLPTMYAAFSRRETTVKLLEVRAGNPPTAVEMLRRYYRNQGLERLSAEWHQWETWFAEIDESHTSLAALVFFRSPQPDHSWVTSAATVLDCASLYLAVIDLPFDIQAALCLRAGYLALQHISDFFQIPYRQVVAPGDMISIQREQFNEAVRLLESTGLPIKPDREQAWLDFSGWRVNYDDCLKGISQLVMAPELVWITADSPQ